jgi:predicted phosphodiesterase
LARVRLAVLSDLHANLEALEAVLSATRGEVDGYLCLGDLVDYGAEPNEVVQRLAELPMLGRLRGNHDSAVCTGDLSRFRTEHGRHSVAWTAERLTPASRSFLQAGAARFTSPELGVDAFHGGPADPEWQYLYPSTDPDTLDRALAQVSQPMMFVGHSHLAFVFARGGRTVVNPGSVGQPRNGDPAAQYALFDSDTRQVTLRRVAYDVQTAAAKIAAAGLDRFLATRLFLGI